jgi:RNA polymerase sigma-70 factor (ECF subfamily)
MQTLETEIDQTAVVLALGDPIDLRALPALPHLSATDLTPKLAAIDARFDLDLTDSLPRLRVYALSLTRNGDRANDLVQQTVLKALAGRHSFQTGSNFGGWVFRIQRNEFISELRRTRPTVDFDAVAAYTLSTPPQQEDRLVLRDVLGAFRQLSSGSRQALLLSRLEGQTHQEIAAQLGIAEGTVKSRISRGRAALARLLDLPIEPGNPDRPGPTSAGPPRA